MTYYTSHLLIFRKIHENDKKIEFEKDLCTCFISIKPKKSGLPPIVKIIDVLVLVLLESIQLFIYFS